MMLVNPVELPLVFAMPDVLGLDDDLQDTLNRLIVQWARKRPRNVVRQQFMDAKAVVRNLDIAVSNEIAEQLDEVCGWPEKAVYMLANMCMWDGVVSTAGEVDPFELGSILRENRFDTEVSQAIASELTHSCVFETTVLGDTAAGEPEVVVMAHSAQWATALWDRTRRALSAGLTVNDVDDLGRPVQVTMYTPSQVIRIRNRGSGWFVDDVRRHGLSRVPMEMLPYRPALDRPFGRSRISRPVMNITSRAIRAILREDVSSELFTAPGLLLNGVDEGTFETINTWSWKMGHLKGLTKGADEEPTKVEVLPQQSMQPYVEQLRALATEFAGITDIPVSALGVVQDNPSSAEAMSVAKENLVIEATNANRVNGHGLARVYQNVVMLRDGLDEVSDELAKVATKWRNPSMPSVVSQSDAMVKQISAIPDLAVTDVALEELGYTDEQIRRIRAQIKAASASQTVREALSSARQRQEVSADGVDGGGAGVQGGQQSAGESGD